MKNKERKKIRKEIKDLTILYATAREEGDDDRHKEVVDDLMVVLEQALANERKRIADELEKEELDMESMDVQMFQRGYNKAIDDILAIINKEE